MHKELNVRVIVFTVQKDANDVIHVSWSVDVGFGPQSSDLYLSHDNNKYFDGAKEFDQVCPDWRTEPIEDELGEYGKELYLSGTLPFIVLATQNLISSKCAMTWQAKNRPQTNRASITVLKLHTTPAGILKSQTRIE